MGEDITKLRKNIAAIKTIMKGGKKDGTIKTREEKDTKPK